MRMRNVISCLAAATLLSGLSATAAGATSGHPVSVCQPNGAGCTPPGTYSGPNALVNGDYGGFKLDWTKSVVQAYSSGVPLFWTVWVTYTNVSSSSRSLTCPDDPTDLSAVQEHMSGGSGDDGTVGAYSTTCSVSPGWSVDVPPGGTAQVFTTFHNVPWPESAVAITWYNAGTTAYVYPFASSTCDSSPVFFGLHGMGEGPSSTIRTISPELESFDKDQNAISGAVLNHPVSYPTVDAQKWRSLLRTGSALLQGENNLQREIRSYTKGCSAAKDKIALVGYSMGAWVVNAWIMDHPKEWDMIRAVVLYGDPCYRGDDLNEGLARLFAYGIGCMPSSDYPYPAARAHVPFQVKTYSLAHDPVSGEDWHGGLGIPWKTAQLVAAIRCTKKSTCSHLDYTGSRDIYAGALFVVSRLVR